MPSTENFEVHLTNVRLTFENIFEAVPPKDNPNGKKTFSASFLMAKNTAEGKANVVKIQAAAAAARKAKWGDNQPNLKPEKLCLRDGDKEDYDGYPGNLYVSTRSPENRRPTVIDRNRSPLTKADGKIYSGCYVNAIVRIWIQDNEFGKRVNASLEGVQFVKDGDAFGKKPLEADAFDDLGDGEFTDSGSSSSIEESDGALI